MNRLISFSKIFQTVLILCFFLPFFKACDSGFGFAPSADELKAKHIADSTHVADSLTRCKTINKDFEKEDYSKIDSIAKIPDSISSNSNKGDSITAKDPRIKNLVHAMFDSIDTKNKRVCFFNRINNDSTIISRLNYHDDKSISKRLIENHKFLKQILQPHEGQSGIGYMLDYWYAFIYLFGIYVSLFLCLFILVFKVLNYFRYLYSNILLSISGFIFLLFTYGSSFNFGKYLWGYWTCLLMWIILMIYDIIILIKILKKEKNET